MWSYLESKTRKLKITVKVFYFDGSMIIEKDEYDSEKMELFMRLWI